MMHQDQNSWDKGREAAARGLPSNCPASLDPPSFASGYVEGQAEANAHDIAELRGRINAAGTETADLRDSINRIVINLLSRLRDDFPLHGEANLIGRDINLAAKNIAQNFEDDPGLLHPDNVQELKAAALQEVDRFEHLLIERGRLRTSHAT